ncbi:MAG: universal stress protein [Bacteroidota bacterium]
MKSHTQPTSPVSSSGLEINQSLIGLELGPTDAGLIRYLDFFSNQVPFNAAYFVHVQPSSGLLHSFLEQNKESFQGAVDRDRLINVMEQKVIQDMTSRKEVYVEYDVREGDPLEQLMQLDEELKTDLVLIGQRTDRRSAAILAKNLIRQSRGNALIVPQEAQPAISTILVPVDFSPNSIKALQTAIALHRQLKQPARILCLNVYTLGEFSLLPDDPAMQPAEAVFEDTIRVGFAAFLNTAAGDYQEHVDIVIKKKMGNSVAKTIQEYAEEEQIDFMVVGAKGHSKVHLMLMGSVTEELLDRNRTIPTLVVK